MTEEITNRVLLEHIQAMKQDLQMQITALDRKVDTGFTYMHRKFSDIDAKLEDARQHREALQEDLVATIRQVAKHEKKLARL
jgi:peptidoglycan hydrolase CwlO-like protein